MKKLIGVTSVVIAFSAVTLFANGNSNGYGQAISGNKVYSMDTVPKKDTSKKKTDSIAYQIKERK